MIVANHSDLLAAFEKKQHICEHFDYLLIFQLFWIFWTVPGRWWDVFIFPSSGKLIHKRSNSLPLPPSSWLENSLIRNQPGDSMWRQRILIYASLWNICETIGRLKRFQVATIVTSSLSCFTWPSKSTPLLRRSSSKQQRLPVAAAKEF